MKRSTRLLLPAIAAITLSAMLPISTNAQNCRQGCDVNPSAPVDGGLTILLAAGLGLGIKKALKNKRSGEENTGSIE